MRTSALDEIGSIDAAPGSRPWCIAMRRELQVALKDAQTRSERLQGLLRLFERHRGFQELEDAKGRRFKSYEAFCVCKYPWGLGYRTEDIDRIIAERKSAEAMAREAEAIGGIGAPKGNRNAAKAEPVAEADDLPLMRAAKENKGSVRTFDRGENSAYLTARIARDHPEILERMKAGEFKSVRAAAIAAGIVKVPTALDVIHKAWRKLSPAERQQFLEWTRVHREEYPCA